MGLIDGLDLGPGGAIGSCKMLAMWIDPPPMEQLRAQLASTPSLGELVATQAWKIDASTGTHIFAINDPSPHPPGIFESTS
jgi:hypothetical protein